MAEKEHVNLVTIGHIDHGKSTLVGRLLFDTGAIREETLRKLKEEAKEKKKETFEFAFVMDKLKEERERGVTIDLAFKEFNTQKYYYTIIDAPGHRDFIKNMIVGTSQADIAILVVSAKEGIQEQTKEHAYLAKILGIGQMIVAINKMDVVNYDESRYKEVKEDVENLLRGVGYKLEDVKVLPISAYKGDNIVKKSENMSWYTGQTLIEALDDIKPITRPMDKPLRLPVQDVYSITGVGTVPVGRVETGVMKQNQAVIIMPAGIKAEIKSIEMHHQPLQEAKAGDNIGFNLRGVGKGDIKKGDVVCDPSNPATVAEEFTAQIIVLNHPTVIAPGYTPVFHIHTAQVTCTITEIIKKMDPKTGQVVQEKPEYIKTGDAAVIKVKPTKPVVIEKQSDFPQLARFAIRDMGQTVAAGVCIDVVPKK
ncbi:MAG TPA: translation elongation factor EF-1 subunit alpha [Candidatus Aenigmarchaeota archaeon]|nr:MAG: translation elongation factor EF-1 subunit alpha [Candidatus Aenigmarchaeota archaeon]HDI06660.1 translation elongation factor EF-1 subunit alpha [Candidatus Aenigmarchaeota archaeon]